MPFIGFSQVTDSIPANCWQEHKHENYPFPDTEYCPLTLCPENISICYNSEDHVTHYFSWKRTRSNQIKMGEGGWKYNILIETENELKIQSVEHPDFIIYLKR
jgi:hypothetical protein